MGFVTQTFAGLWWALRGITRSVVIISVLAARSIHTMRLVVTPKWWPVAILALLVITRQVTAITPSWAVPLTGVTAAAGVLAYLRDRLSRPEHWAYTLTCVAATVLGLILAAAGAGGWLDTAGVIVWVALSLPWWLHTPPVPPIPVTPGPEPELPQIQQDWDNYVRGGPGSMSGAILLPLGTFAHGQEYAIRVVPGKQHLGTFTSGMPSLTTALNIPSHRMLIECLDPERPRVLRFRVVTTSPIERPVYFTGPKLVDGRIILGPYADGMDTASWRLFTLDSMWGGFILGDIGSGKTRLLEMIALVARHAGCFIVYIDGQGGASSPTLWAHADWSGGLAEAETIRSALERGKTRRQVYNRLNKLPGFNSDGGITPVLVITDECHGIFLPPTAKQWAKFNRESRKIGMSNIGASQFSGLETFGGSDVLRSSLLAGNAVALRTSSAISAQLIPGLDMNPALFPKMPGYGYYIPDPQDAGSRKAPFRAEWLPDGNDKAKHLDIPVPGVEEWFGRIPHAELDEMTAGAFGPDYANRHEIAARRDEADRESLTREFDPGERREARIAGTAADQLDAASAEVASVMMELLAGEAMTLPEIIKELANAGHRPSVFTVRAALNSLTMDNRVSLDGGVYRRAA